MDGSIVQYFDKYNIGGDITRIVFVDHYLECWQQGVFEEPMGDVSVVPKVNYDQGIKHAACGSRSRRNKG